jgi:hypothetical protein
MLILSKANLHQTRPIGGVGSVQINFCALTNVKFHCVFFLAASDAKFVVSNRYSWIDVTTNLATLYYEISIVTTPRTPRSLYQISLASRKST